MNRENESALNVFRKILIANRGEIALRIVRACRETGVASAAVYAAVDREGLWVQEADEAHELAVTGGREAYLSVEAILHAAKKAKADAIHPGYGFLSERSRFAAACEEAGFAFVGPSAKAMDAAGDKVKARKLAVSIGLPVLPGTPPLAGWDEAQKAARGIGFPLLIKAAAGGGGRGMRLVRHEKEVRDAYEAASREALASFGDGTVYFEKYVARPRHVEIQVMADRHGGAFHLGERECSIQRRYQKLIEEAPSPALNETLRARMGESALSFVRGIGYVNAGTVEFLLDEEGHYYFLEMNARIQVEHPVTEMVTGLDLVKAQLAVASGEKLQWKQEAIGLRGSAIEARINCEDPSLGFLPSPGRVASLRLPGGPGVRVDTALYPGYDIPQAFDSLIAKLVVWGENRGEAIARMRRALAEFRVAGVPTTIPFHSQVFAHPAFANGELSTKFIEEHIQGKSVEISEEEAELAAIAAALDAHPPARFARTGTAENRWSMTGRRENVK